MTKYLNIFVALLLIATNFKMILDIYQISWASDLYVTIALNSLFYVLFNIPFLLSGFIQNQSFVDISTFLMALSQLFFIAFLYRVYRLKFNKFKSSNTLIIMIIVTIGVVLHVISGNEWDQTIQVFKISSTALPISFVRTIPSTLIGLSLSIMFYLNGRMSEAINLEILPIFIALYVMLQLANVLLVPASIQIGAYYLQLLLATSITYLLYRDFRNSIYY